MPYPFGLTVDVDGIPTIGATHANAKKITEFLKSKGYDGVIVTHGLDPKTYQPSISEAVVFDKSQIIRQPGIEPSAPVPARTGVDTMLGYSGPAFRVEPGFEGGAPRGATAQDVITEEMERKSIHTLDEFGIDDATYDALENVPASDLVWVGRSREDLIAAYGPQSGSYRIKAPETEAGSVEGYAGLFSDPADISDVSTAVSGARVLYEDEDGVLLWKKTPQRVEPEYVGTENIEMVAIDEIEKIKMHGLGDEDELYRVSLLVDELKSGLPLRSALEIEDGVLVDGHHRLRALKEAGFTHAPVLVSKTPQKPARSTNSMLSEKEEVVAAEEASTDEPWIGVLLEDGTHEFRNMVEGAEADWHHSFALENVDHWDTDAALSFVRDFTVGVPQPRIILRGGAVLDPFGKGKAQITDLAKRLIDAGMPGNYEMKVDQMLLNTPYEGKSLGTIEEWGLPEEKPVNAMVKAEEPGRIGYGDDFNYHNVTPDQQLVIDLGDAQRALPEEAMRKAQTAVGGGELQVLVEHIGDLTHRMTEKTAMSYRMGYEFVVPKVRQGLSSLRNRYFDRTVRENFEGNASVSGKYGGKKKTVEEWTEDARVAMEAYAKEHEKLPVYNEMQRAARDAAVALGYQMYGTATKELRILQDVIDKGQDAWAAEASKFNRAFEKQRGSLGENKPSKEIKKQGAKTAGSSLHKLEVAKQARKTKDVRALTPAESKVVKENVPKNRQTVVAASIRNTKSNYPEDAGWMGPLEVQKVTEAENRQGLTVYPVDYRELKYTFARDDFGKPMPENPNDLRWFEEGDARNTRVNEISDAMVKEVLDIRKRAAAGDHNAQVIVRQSEWYSVMRRELRVTYGGFGDLFADLLGALSPITDVETNWKNAVEVLERFTKGEFRPEVRSFVAFLEGGGTPGNYEGPVPKQINDKLFGANSRNLLMALADLWRVIEPGTAPKARNFSGNLIGLLNDATIDRWAARTLQRLAGHKRLPPIAEPAVQGNWNASATAITGDFAFGQEVYALAAAQLDMLPDSLQALMWFAEKDIWAQHKGWSTKAGEGGAFEEQAAKEMRSRLTAGVSLHRDVAPQTPEMAAPVGDALWNILAADDTVKAVKVEQSSGMFMSEVEPNFDVELVVGPDYDTETLLSEVASMAKEANQDSAFVSRVVAEGSVPSENVRPGIEVYFSKSTDMAGAAALVDALRAMGVDGFTVIKDPRGTVVGVRYQYIPEYDILYGGKSVDEVPDLIQSRREMLDDILNDVAELDNVSHAEILDYDTIVMTENNYDDFIATGSNRLRSLPGKIWAGRTLDQSIRSATESVAEVNPTQFAKDPGSNALIGEVR